jgi:hypothetical protein
MACTHHGWGTGDRKFHVSTAAATFKHGLSFILNAVLYINTVPQEYPMFFSALLHVNEFLLWVGGLNRSRGTLRRSVGGMHKVGSWLCFELRQLASFTTGAQPWKHRHSADHHCVNA